MKNNILIGSVVSAVTATVLGIGAVLVQNTGSDVESLSTSIVTSIKLYQVASMFGLLSIASFFVGWVYPSNGTTTGNGKVLNIRGKRGA